jgi:ubiquinone/menaquinone biosynthesis C-methylase UbiE
MRRVDKRQKAHGALSSSESIAARVARERASYECGTVFDRSAAIHRRFEHVLTNPNVARGERHFANYIDEISPNGYTLEIGCGAGVDVLKYRAFKLSAIDLSFRPLNEARRRYGQKTLIFQMDAHRTGFRDESFDAIVGRSILHHLDYESALIEIYRILKVGGVAIFAEPLSDNPAARLWRAFTPGARTVDEKALSRRQIHRGDSLFARHHHRFVNLVSTPLAMLTSLVLKEPNNRLLQFANRLDIALERTPARYWMRTAYLVWRK